jgi:hypothetical protein
VWHASIAKISARCVPIPAERWGEGVTREAKRQLGLVLDGVGQEPSVASMTRSTLHIRRSLSQAEIDTLSPEWLAIPALDEFSQEGEIEMEL